MNKSTRRALAATTAGVAVAATLAAATPAAQAGQGSQAAGQSREYADRGFKGSAEGVRLYVNNVMVKSLNDAAAAMRCTREIGRGKEASSVLTTPENDLINLSASTSRTKSYRDGALEGVRSVNTLGDIVVGDAEAGTPTVTIKGLTTVADAFYDKSAGKYAYDAKISKMDLDIELLPGQDPSDDLDALLNAIPEGLQEVLAVLDSVAVPIEIPDLGSIALAGRTKGEASNHHAEADAAALELVVTATGETQKLLLGHSRARVGGPTYGGVFKSSSMPMEVDVLDGLARFGGVRPKTISCEGSNGKVRTRKVESASVLLPQNLLAGVSGVTYKTMGDQRRNGTAEGFTSNEIGAFTINPLGLEITGIASKVATKKVKDSRTRTGYRIVSKPSFSVAKIVHDGTEYAVPKPGNLLEIDGLGVLQTRVVESTKWGKRVTALRLTLTEYGDTQIDLGLSASQIYDH